MIESNQGSEILEVSGAISSLQQEDIFSLKCYHAHCVRLFRFCRPLHKSFTMGIDSSERTKGAPTELRLSALFNEIRPFTLQGDPVYFLKIIKIIKRYWANDKGAQDRLDRLKKEWLLLDAKSASQKKMPVCFNVGDKEIKTYAALIDIMMYGKYIHNDKNGGDRAQTFSALEHAWFEPAIRWFAGNGISQMSTIISHVDKEFTVSIIHSAGSINIQYGRI